MAFSISQFKSALERHGGPARNNLFEVSFNSPNSTRWSDSTFNNDDLRFFCKAATLPGISLTTFDYRPTNIEMPQSLPFAVNHEQLECVFIVDDRHRVYRYFHRWLQQIVNYNTDGYSPGSAVPSTAGSNGAQYPWEFGYKKEYSQIMTLRKFSRDLLADVAENQYICQMFGVYPTSIGSTTLSWEENDTYSVLPVSFSYTSLIMSGVAPNIET